MEEREEQNALRMNRLTPSEKKRTTIRKVLTMAFNITLIGLIIYFVMERSRIECQREIRTWLIVQAVISIVSVFCDIMSLWTIYCREIRSNER